jgi:hypothetical protein
MAFTDINPMECDCNLKEINGIYSNPAKETILNDDGKVIFYKGSSMSLRSINLLNLQYYE